MTETTITRTLEDGRRQRVTLNDDGSIHAELWNAHGEGSWYLPQHMTAPTAPPGQVVIDAINDMKERISRGERDSVLIEVDERDDPANWPDGAPWLSACLVCKDERVTGAEGTRCPKCGSQYPGKDGLVAGPGGQRLKPYVHYPQNPLQDPPFRQGTNWDVFG